MGVLLSTVNTILGLLLCLLPAVATAQQQHYDGYPMPLDEDQGRYIYRHEAYFDSYNRLEHFFAAAKFVGKEPLLRDILTFDVIHTDSLLIYANGFLAPVIDEVRVLIEYKIRIQFGPDGYSYWVYNFRLDGYSFETIFHNKSKYTGRFLQVMQKTCHLTHNHVTGVMNTLNQVLLGLEAEQK